MSWFLLALVSALFLGFYDLAKKASVHENAVWPVLFCCSAFYALILSPCLFFIEPLTLHEHFLLLGKSIIVAGSWGFTYNAIAKLPLSVSAPIRATAPLFTIAIAVIFMGERPSLFQWLGIFITVSAYLFLRSAGRKEIGHFFSNRWVICMLLGTILAACSGIYDKFILQWRGFSPLTVQVWFSIYMTLLQFLMVLFVWRPKRKTSAPFQFRASFFAVAILLILADRMYFLSVSNPDALVSIVTVFRRSSVIIGFLAGLFIFKERKSKSKIIALIGIITGLCIIALG